MLNYGFIENLKYLILLYFTYSFCGWVMESVGGIFKVKKFVNRGFLIGPYCPVYGVGVSLITVLLGKYTNDIPVLFVLSIVLCGTLEYMTSYFMEKIFNARWWDYHNRKFNINGRICLETLIPFGIAGTTICCIINPFFIGIYSKMNNFVRLIIVCSLSIVHIIDIIVSFVIISSFKGQIYNSKDNTEEISNKVKDITEEIGEELVEKTEDNIMKFESDIKYSIRKAKIKNNLRIRKVKYRRLHIKKSIMLANKELLEKIKTSKSDLKEKLSKEIDKTKNNINDRKNNVVTKLNRIKDEDISKEIINRFSKKSIFTKRLMESFPDLKVIIKDKNKKS